MAPSLTLAYVLIVIGLILLVAEFFTPSSGVLLVLSIGLIITGVVLTFLYSEDLSTGVVTLIVVFVALPVLVGTLVHYWPRTPLGRRLLLDGPQADATVASMPVNLELEQLRGRFGRAVSPLRPAGVAEFDGKRVDVITEGMMVDAGQSIRCIEVKAARVVVRAAPKPDLGDLENAIFPSG